MVLIHTTLNKETMTNITFLNTINNVNFNSPSELGGVLLHFNLVNNTLFIGNENMEERCYCVYMHTCKANGKKYIGQTKQFVEQRWRSGKGYKGSNPYFTNAINKYGWDGFEHEVLHENLTKDEANEIEIKLIAKYNTTNRKYGYNSEIGGNNSPCSEHTKKLISLNHADMKGENNPRYGVKLSDETKAKIGNANRGRVISEETRLKLSKANSGTNNGFYGKKHTNETKEKLRQQKLDPTNPMNMRVKCVETGEVFYSMAEAARHYGIKRARISEATRGVKETAAGYHWVRL